MYNTIEVIKMNCYFNFCIYNKDYLCTLDKISINSAGICDECMPVNFSSPQLEDEKNKQIKNLEKLREKFNKDYQ